MMAGASEMTARMRRAGPIACPAREEAMASELHWSIGNHDEDEEIMEPCRWCQEPDGDDCRCYTEQDEEEYAR